MKGRALSRRLAALPIRWRLALTSAGLTFAILLVFALVVGAFTIDRLRAEFDEDLRTTADDVADELPVSASPFGEPQIILGPEAVEAIVGVAATGDATVRLLLPDRPYVEAGAPDLGPPRAGVSEVGGYRVVSVPLLDTGSPEEAAFLQYGRSVAELDATVGRLQLFLALGVVGGTLLALLAGLAVARRAVGPIAGLANAARGVARTRDPAALMPRQHADDEVADLARTLEDMLRALDAARRETESTLAREREFVADASHELRTPLTSVLANLELLEPGLRGEDREIVASALRSTQRIRRLVGDLLFLARADAGKPSPATLVPTDLGAIVRDAVAETAPLATGHAIAVDAPEPVVVRGSPDDLHRLALNLVQNAVAHTPPGTRVTAGVRAEHDVAVLEVADDGPGIAPDRRERIFDRFVRGEGAGRTGAGAGSGLGLAIVAAVAAAHEGDVALHEAPGGGARFLVRLPLAGAPQAPAARAHQLGGSPTS